MKRSIGGGAARGPVAHGRQRRTIRMMQGVLVMCGVALLVYAGITLANVLSYDRGAAIDASVRPGVMQPVTLVVGSAIAFGVAAALGGRGGVRLPTPARLEELAGRAERAALERAEALATTGENDREDTDTNAQGSSSD
ncbi:MAG TPA: hypothetical protein VM784_08625 [Actinomycetota bacterium]|nr:hypothetical protein [Actinomycetota bacterium]